MSYTITDYARDTKKELTYKLAEMIFEDLETKISAENKSFRSAIAEFNSETTYSDKFAEFLDSFILITDRKGVVMYTSGSLEKGRKPYVIPQSVLKEFYDNLGVLSYSDMGGVLSKKYLNVAFPLTAQFRGESEDFGLLLIGTPTASMGNTMESLILTTVFALLWVFTMAFTALYFISRRLNQPILLIQKKLRSFSTGDFSVRMEPTGVAEIDTIADSFNDMAESLEKIDNSRKNFISNVSHDLRTPMTSIQGFVDAILDGTVKPDKQRHYLTVISGEVKRLSRLVNTLLDITRMESGSLVLERTSFDICEMTRLIVISLEEKFIDKNIEFNLESENYRTYVYADKDSIYQVLYNLIENAVKFTNEGGNIKVILHDSTETDPSRKLEISVYNTGDGIPENERKKVFDKFFKSDFSRGIDKKGVGLGLFIVKTKLEALGEKISVDSVYGSCCRFTFALTRGEAPEQKTKFADNPSLPHESDEMPPAKSNKN